MCSTTLNTVSHAAGDDALVDSLLVAARALVGVAARSLADEDGVTLPQFRALVLIAERPRTTVSDLGGALGIHSTSATRLCDRLARKQLLRRVEAADDRRQTELHLAAAGRRLVERVTARRRSELSAIVSRMDPVDVDGAVLALSAFAAAADGLAAEAHVLGRETPGR